jgi:hypothetical protein
VWEASALNQVGLLLQTPQLALHDEKTHEGLPCMIVQIRNFACGSVAVAVELTHPLADAQLLLRFTKYWALVNRAMVTDLEVPLPVVNPVFDPQTLDRAALGNIDAHTADSVIMA